MILLDAIRLCLALSTLPDVAPGMACAAAVPIVLAADEFDPALIGAIAYSESRFDPSAYNARTNCGGPMGVRGFRSGVDGYRAGVVVLREAVAYCVRRGTPGQACMLAAYASGPRGPRLGLYRQPNAILRRAARIRRAMALRPGGAA